MPHLLAILGADSHSTRPLLAGEALRHAAQQAGCRLDVDVRTPDTLSAVAATALANADAVVWAGVAPDAAARQANPRMIEVALDDVLADARAVLARMLDSPRPAHRGRTRPAHRRHHLVPDRHRPYLHGRRGADPGGQRTRPPHPCRDAGLGGAQNTLSADAIAQADIVLIAADTQVDLSRFEGKRVFRSGTKAAIHDGQALIRRALAEAAVAAPSGQVQADAGASATPPNSSAPDLTNT